MGVFTIPEKRDKYQHELFFKGKTKQFLSKKNNAIGQKPQKRTSIQQQPTHANQRKSPTKLRNRAQSDE